MSLTKHESDFLPYIDDQSGTYSVDSVNHLVAAAMKIPSTGELHPSIPKLNAPAYPALFQKELDRLAAMAEDLGEEEELDPEQARMVNGINEDRYANIPSLPKSALLAGSEAMSQETEKSGATGPTNLSPETAAVLKSLYTTRAYLGLRQDQLQLLSTHGKNAWLIGNDSAEQLLLNQERELARINAQMEQLNQARKAAQGAARPSLESADAAWRDAVGRRIEVQLALSNMPG